MPRNEARIAEPELELLTAPVTVTTRARPEIRPEPRTTEAVASTEAVVPPRPPEVERSVRRTPRRTREPDRASAFAGTRAEAAVNPPSVPVPVPEPEPTRTGPTADLALTTDASDVGAGTVLEQWSRGSWQPVAFYSRKFTAAQTRYSTYDRELTAIFLAVQHFRHMLEGRQFTIFTDQQGQQGQRHCQPPPELPVQRHRRVHQPASPHHQ